MSEYEPLLIERAEGCTLVDVDGREYLDGVSSLWCNVHGHRHPRLDAALVEQMRQVAHVTSLGMSNPTTVRFAKRLVDITPAGLDHVFFSSDGSSAIEVALKMAYQYWHQRDDPRPDKTKYVAFGNAYHGDTMGSVSVGGVMRFHEMFASLLFDVVRAPSPDQYRLPPGRSEESACADYLQDLETLLQQHSGQVAALIIEPLMQGAAGMVKHPAGFLSGVRELTRRHDVLMIADEVAVGFGRTGRMFACEHERVAPDLMCLAKGISGGYLPMSATLATTEIWNAFLGTYAESKTLFHGHTYGGNPLAAAVGLASLEVFDDERVLEKLVPKIERLGQHLARIGQHPHVGDVRQCGLMAGIELVQDRETKEAYPWEEQRGKQVCELAIRDGVWVRPLANVVVVMPPLSVTLEELDRICLAIEAGIAQVCP